MKRVLVESVLPLFSSPNHTLLVAAHPSQIDTLIEEFASMDIHLEIVKDIENFVQQ